MTLIAVGQGVDQSPAELSGLAALDWVMVGDEQIMTFLTDEYFSDWKAQENLREADGRPHRRPILLLSEPQSLQPIQEICPRSTSGRNGIPHAAHSHHPRLATTRGVDPEPSCTLNEEGWAVERFSADSDRLFAGVLEYSCHEPEGSDLLSALKRADWL